MCVIKLCLIRDVWIYQWRRCDTVCCNVKKIHYSLNESFFSFDLRNTWHILTNQYWVRSFRFKHWYILFFFITRPKIYFQMCISLSGSVVTVWLEVAKDVLLWMKRNATKLFVIVDTLMRLVFCLYIINRVYYFIHLKIFLIWI